ncbi:sensor histidine kinase [Massilia sp. ST3]|uniref:sensor histidine kinase n=1 Tax=Massilia sp. ST3 TaxID=2824903 RepID=UPI001B83536F|nr:hypothetical protein [Massilia sp. ST3]MBQ5946314.1 hypothetical protein [Massilia sp. ST3]
MPERCQESGKSEEAQEGTFEAVEIETHRGAVDRQPEHQADAEEPDPADGHFLMVFLAIVFSLLFSLLAMRGERKERERADRLGIELEKNRLERELDARLNDADATLKTELQLVRSYLELMQLRMPDHLRFSVSAPPMAGSLRFPAMALLTLVENAVRHGIDPSTEGGHIDVGARCDQATGKVTAWVGDTGAGMQETAQPGVGLAKLRKRLQGFYGSSARIELHEAAPHGVLVELHFHPEDTP